jgi:CRISPR-associated protein Cas1
VVARNLVASGLLPTFGIHHHNRYNAYALADDIMEPYRPYVDRVVLEILDKHKTVENLTPEIKKELLQIPVLDVTIEGQRNPLMVGMQQTTASLSACFAGETRKIKYPDFG